MNKYFIGENHWNKNKYNNDDFYEMLTEAKRQFNLSKKRFFGDDIAEEPTLPDVIENHIGMQYKNN